VSRKGSARGGKRGRIKATRELEWYPTPGYVTDVLLRHLRLPKRRSLSLLDPCSGDGAIVDVIDATRGSRDVWTTFDIRPEARGARTGTHYTGDMLELLVRLASDTTTARWDLGVSNPPFTQASQLVELLVPRCDRTALLLGVDWYSGQRAKLLERFPPCRMIVIPERISFDGKGSDQRTYAWFVWDRSDIGATNVATVIEMAEPTDPLVVAQWRATARERIYQHDLERAGQFRLVN
jgi:methylase of polypeptide subunit release factors